MQIDKADAFAMKCMAVDEAQSFVVVSNDGCGEVLQQFQDGRPVGQAATGNLSHNEWMHNDRTALNQRGKLRITTAQVIDTHRRIDQNQDLISGRLRGEAFNMGCEPPS